MVKTVLGVKHQGLRDWIVQRISALYMAVFSFGFVYFFLTHRSLEFADWHHLFSLTWMKVASLLCLGLLLWHAWIGMWTIFTDYVKPFILRCFLSCLVLLCLIATFLWGVLILWGV